MDNNDRDPIELAHVLVIDSDDAILAESRDRLEAAGYRVTTADLPDIGILRRFTPDAVVVGIFYRGDPGGIGFLEHNATDPVLARVPAIVRAAATGLTAADQDRLSALRHPIVAGDDYPALLAQLNHLLVPVGA
jgi:CheY-like chemotaxis protein